MKKSLFLHNLKGLCEVVILFLVALTRNGAFWRITLGGLLVLASPQVGEVVTGNATISSPNSQTVIINQTGNKAIINWKSFNIGPQEKTHFQQPPGGIALNRINPQQGVSQIYGVLTATGQIILVNPAGIFFGPGAYVNVGGLIATTGQISNQDFLNDIYRFTNLSAYPNASIINEGTIIAAQHGLIAIVAPSVVNKGLIEANIGNVILASGNAFTINFDANNLISFSVDEKTLGQITNEGTLRANGGQILVTAKTAQNVLDNVINVAGIIEAKTVTQHNGEIILGNIKIASDQDSGIVKVASKIDASGKLAGQKGGQVEITGHNILIDSPAVIDVSGDLGGGNIYIGGSFQGKGPLPNAKAVILAPNATLIADAVTLGTGGDIILWSDDVTKAYGNISAQGGKITGNGGFIEVSSKNYLSFLANVNVRAPYGNPGKLLLDPMTIFIIEGAAGSGDLDRSFDHAILAFDVHDMPENTVSVGQLQSFGDIDIILQAKEALTIGASDGSQTKVSLPELTRSTLTLQAGDLETINGGNIIFNTGSSIITGGGGVTIIAGNEKQKTGNATLGAISTSGGDISVTAQEGVTINDVIDAGRGAISMTALNRGLTINNDITSSDNSISLTGANITQGANTTVNALSGMITYNAGPGIITTNINTQIYSTGIINLIANNMILDTRSLFSQIGGINPSTYATNVILSPGTANTTIGIAGGLGTLSLSQAELNTIHATNARIGSSTSGVMRIGTWTPGTTFVPGSGVLTLHSGQGIIQSGAITLNSGDNLFLRGSGNFALTNANNIFSNIAANLTSGSLSITNAPTKPLTVTSMSDDLGSVSGIIAPSGVTISASGTGGSLTINKGILTTNNSINLSGRNITLADNVYVRSGTGNITMSAETGTLTLNFNSRLLAGNTTGTVGTINLIADNMAFNSTQIGGTGIDTGSVKTVIFQPNTPGRLIGIAGGAGNLSLTETELSKVRATNVRIGNATSGPIVIGTSGATWTPASTFATNLLTLQTASSITQTASSSMNLGTRNLILRDATNITLTGPNNIFNSVAADTTGSLLLTSAGINPLTIATLTDDQGTVTGITALSGVLINATNASSAIVLNAPISANLAGNSIVLVAPKFTNNLGASALNPGVGRFLVWSGNPANDDRGDLNYAFKQYNATYGSSMVFGNGSGFLYTVAPVIVPGLSGTITKVYDTTTAATLASSNYISSGAIDSDIIILNNPVSGSYDTANVGANKNVSVTGIAIASATDGSAVVYGYQLSSTTANANIGTITPAFLTAGLTGTISKIYDATTLAILAASNYTLSGVLGSDVVSLNNPTTGSYENHNVGTGLDVTVSNLAISGPNAGNYQLTSTSVYADVGTITPASLTVSGIQALNKTYDASRTAILNTNSAHLQGVLDNDVIYLNTSGYQANFATQHIGKNISVLVSNLGLSGPSASNYILIQPTGLMANIVLPGLPPAGAIFPTQYQPPGSNVPAKTTPLVIENQIASTPEIGIGIGKSISIEGENIGTMPVRLPELKAVAIEHVMVHKPATVVTKVFSKKVKELEISPSP